MPSLRHAKRRAVAAAVGVSAVTGVGAGVLATSPAFGSGPVPEQKIVFTRSQNSTSTRDLFVINADGSGERQLTSADGDLNDDPAWSPDRTKIAYSGGNLHTSTDEIYVVNADGTNTQQLTTGLLSAITPSWSPDGTKIAFVQVNTSSENGIYVMNADGTDVVRLTDGQYDRSPSWSPDGSKIAFARRMVSYSNDIYVMDADGSNQTNVTNSLSSEDADPSWSPDSSRIAYTGGSTYNPDVYVMNADGSDNVDVTNVPGYEQHPSWSPDSAQIAFTRGGAEIDIMNADGSGQRAVTTSSIPSTEPAWGTAPQLPLPPAPSPSPTPVPVTSTAPPVIAGTDQVGAILHATSGGWDPVATYAYQWRADGAPIAGATAPTYVLKPAQLGKHITVTVSAVAEGYLPAAATSVPSKPVAPGRMINVKLPVVNGVAKVGRTVTVLPGAWKPSSSGYHYQWLRDGRPIPGAQHARLRLTLASKGHRIALRVTPHRIGYVGSPSTSRATAKVR